MDPVSFLLAGVPTAYCLCLRPIETSLRPVAAVPSGRCFIGEPQSTDPVDFHRGVSPFGSPHSLPEFLDFSHCCRFGPLVW